MYSFNCLRFINLIANIAPEITTVNDSSTINAITQPFRPLGVGVGLEIDAVVVIVVGFGHPSSSSPFGQFVIPSHLNCFEIHSFVLPSLHANNDDDIQYGLIIMVGS